MPRVVPSQVLELVDKLFPAVKEEKQVRLGGEYAPALAGILKMTDSIPDELIQLSGSDYADFALSLGGIKLMLETWISRGGGDAPQKIGKEHPLTLLRRALAKCPDEVPSPNTTELPFIGDADLRASIRRDIGAANSSLHNGEWKGATVLAGSAVEALLLWGIETRKPADVDAAIDASVRVNALQRRPKDRNLETWDLHEYIEIAKSMNLVTSETAEQARLAKSPFEN